MLQSKVHQCKVTKKFLKVDDSLKRKGTFSHEGVMRKCGLQKKKEYIPIVHQYMIYFIYLILSEGVNL
ncbi:hypothetical protein D8M05_03670 [Oceanobacillus bengalensis]|uniref:Uncharacterized protein n=1 Tax=Oceanobacillus bengalensis TaxID=1435466 RepID=A0A494Z4P5_9BACI|nr:hypothetical protein D8M05_03670 [Oceanobacillus bengalensis]